MAMPPTTHALPQTHRAHLIRSTRKVGALLGETPLLLDPTHSRSSSVESTSSIESKRSGRIFRGSPAPPRSSSLAAAEGNTARAASPAPTRPLLYLRLAPTPRPTSLAAPSPCTPAFSPLTPTFPPPVDRRRKMAKLVRTLGQNVPPELVFSAPPPVKRPTYVPSPVLVPAMLSALSPTPRRSYAAATSPVSPTGSLASPTREAAAAAMSYRRADSDSDDEQWVDLAPPSPRSPHYLKASPTWNASSSSLSSSGSSWNASPGPGAYAAPAGASTTSRGTADARFLSRHVRVDFPDLARAYSSDRSDSRADSRLDSRSDSRADSDPYARSNSRLDSYASADENGTHRREQGWSGEWSGAAGMQDVVRGLRGLRIK
ncbi:hypothetical protein FB451DRAFT_1563647 [Mycena latifolia]|nr:hypothetical protein FB451DRAFT_1563647 [Mycena latifolia]